MDLIPPDEEQDNIPKLCLGLQGDQRHTGTYGPLPASRGHMNSTDRLLVMQGVRRVDPGTHGYGAAERSSTGLINASLHHEGN